jgi:hypothetical protein
MTVLRREGTLSRLARREGDAVLRIAVARLLRAVLLPSTRNSFGQARVISSTASVAHRKPASSRAIATTTLL